MKVKIKKLNENAVIPSYSKFGDAGMDLTATKIIKSTEDYIVYGTSIALEIPKGHVGLVFPRSSIRKYSLILSNSVGVIDSGYRGEIQVTFLLTHLKDLAKIYEVGDRVCQIMIIPYPKVELVLTQELTITERNDKGHGSSGR